MNLNYRVYYEDTDCMGIVYHANYLKFCERARSEMFFDTAGEKFLQNNAFAVREINAVYKASAKLGDIITVSCEVKKIDKFCIFMQQNITRGDEICFSASVKLVHLKDGKLAIIDEELQKFLETKGELC